MYFTYCNQYKPKQNLTGIRAARMKKFLIHREMMERNLLQEPGCQIQGIAIGHGTILSDQLIVSLLLVVASHQLGL